MEKTKRSLAKVRIIYVASTIFLAVVSFYTYSQIINLIDSYNLVNHTNTINQSLQKIFSTVLEAETNKRGFMLSGDSALIGRRDTSIKMALAEVKLLDSLIADNPAQVENIKLLKSIIDVKLESLRDMPPVDTSLQSNDSLKSNIIPDVYVMDNIKASLHKMRILEMKLLEISTQKYPYLSYIASFLIIVLSLSALFILLVSYLRISKAFLFSVSLQKKFEEEKIFAQTILNASPDNIIVLDKELRYISANPNAEKLLFKFTDDYIGKRTIDVFPNGEAEADMKKVLDGDVIYLSSFYSKVAKSYFEIIYTPLKREEEIIGLIAQSRDVSNIFKISKRLKKQNSELIRINKELELFAHISSHDLQEPIRKIRLFASRILEKEYDNLSENGKNYFRIINDAASIVQTLNEDLITYSQTTNEERRFKKTDLNDIVKEVEIQLKEEIEEKKVVIVVGQLCEIPIIPFQFTQMMYNLLGNAIKFSNPEIQPVITIKGVIIKGSETDAVKLLSEEDYCHISMSDNGIGFEPEYSKKIFDLFQRLNRKEKYKGTGIGLAIVKKIVENHNGFIIATGKLNKGATFDIYIPTNQ